MTNQRLGGSKKRPPLLSGSSGRRGGGSIRGIPTYIWMSAAGLTGTLAYSYFAYLEEVPLTKRKRWIGTSEEMEQQLGDEEYRKLLLQFRGNILPPTHPAAVTVQRVGSRIANASRNFAAEHPATSIAKVPYTYTVVRSNQANAFVLPNNHVFVLTGLFKYVKDEVSDDACLLSALRDCCLLQANERPL